MMPTLTILQGDWIERLRELPEASAHCCVTSPPYWGLRDYGVAGQLGLEKTPEEYVAKLVEGFREVRRVLREDGTMWVNLGDSYARDFAEGGSGPNGKHDYMPDYGNARRILSESKGSSDGKVGRGDRAAMRVSGCGLKPKDLVGIPWRVAFALQADGWYLRSDIIWHKPNPMPESVTDRPTKAHEYIFLMSKRERYYYDAEAIKEPVLNSSLVRAEAGVAFGGKNLCPDTRLQSGKLWYPKPEGANSRMNRSRDPAHEGEYSGKHRTADDQSSGRRMLKNCATARANGGEHDAPFGANRNKRSVWTVATAPYKEAHFATFPPDLIKPCILAATSSRRCCPKCGKGWERIMQRTARKDYQYQGVGIPGESDQRGRRTEPCGGSQFAPIDWNPGCECGAASTIPAVVLDPFGGSGTTGQVALELGRSAVLIELNPKYVELMRQRTDVTAGLAL